MSSKKEFFHEPNADDSSRIEKLENEKKHLEQEIITLRERLKKDTQDARDYGQQKFAKDMITVADNLTRGLKSIDINDNSILKNYHNGFIGVERNFLTNLSHHGITRHDPIGEIFDPNTHQAMGETHTGTTPSGHIAETWSPAWFLNGRLLQAALVIVKK